MNSFQNEISSFHFIQRQFINDSFDALYVSIDDNKSVTFENFNACHRFHGGVNFDDVHIINYMIMLKTCIFLVQMQRQLHNK